MDFEKTIEQLENIVEQLGSGKLTLENSLKFFEKGMLLSEKCSKQLDKSEKKVQQLININNKGIIKTKDFEISD